MLILNAWGEFTLCCLLFDQKWSILGATNIIKMSLVSQRQSPEIYT